MQLHMNKVDPSSFQQRQYISYRRSADAPLSSVLNVPTYRLRPRQ